MKRPNGGPLHVPFTIKIQFEEERPYVIGVSMDARGGCHFIVYRIVWDSRASIWTVSRRAAGSMVEGRGVSGA